KSRIFICRIKLMVKDNYISCKPLFFHAYDGIRALHVTGVQTCALPIFRRLGDFPPKIPGYGRDRRQGVLGTVHLIPGENPLGPRSEERRVGEEGWTLLEESLLIESFNNKDMF